MIDKAMIGDWVSFHGNDTIYKVWSYNAGAGDVFIVPLISPSSSDQVRPTSEGICACLSDLMDRNFERAISPHGSP
jgi:hypothetical protein